MVLPNPLNSEEIRLLTEVGFLAAALGNVPRAETIFCALERVRPTRAFPYVGLATCYMNAARPDDAVRALDRGAPSVTPDDFAVLEALRALALQLAGRRSESLRAARAASDAPLAQAMLRQGTMQHEEP